MKNIKLIVICVFLFNCSSDNNSIPNAKEIVFINTLGGAQNERLNAVINSNDGGYVATGFSQSNDGDLQNKANTTYDYWVIKFDSNDNLLWNKTFGGSGDDRSNSIIQTTDGGYAVMGSSSSSDGDTTENYGFQDFWITKLDSSGNLSWQKSFGFSGIDTAFSVIQTNDNGYLLSGVLDVTASEGEGNSRSISRKHAGGDFWVIKLDSSGEKLWSKFYGGTFSDTPFGGAIETPDNNYIIVGSSDSNDVDIQNSKGGYDFWVIKISGTGDLIWERSFGGEQIDEGRSITTSHDGNFIIVGDTRSNDQDVNSNNGAADLWIIKISPEGNLIWEKTFGGNSSDVGSSVRRTSDNGFILTGNSRSANGDLTINQGQNDAWVLKLDSNGNLLWQKTIGGSDIDLLNDASELNDGSIIAVGESRSSDFDIQENKGFSDALIIKIE